MAMESFLFYDGASIALTFGLRAVYIRLTRRSDEFFWLGIAVVVLCICGGFLQAILHWFVGDIFPSEHRTIFGNSVALGIFYFRFGVLVCWSLLYLFIERQREESERELRLLRAQMNPHLLSNAMQHIQAELETRYPKIGEMVQSLMNYLNYSLRHQKDDSITMGEEYDALMDFLELEKLLFGSKLDIGCQIESSIRAVQVPGVILQPLVENAVKYGLQTHHSSVSVRLDVRREKSILVIQVCNTGHWIEPNPDRTSGGIGLDNVRRRLKQIYGRKHRLETFEEEGWVTVRVSLPIRL